MDGCLKEFMKNIGMLHNATRTPVPLFSVVSYVIFRSVFTDILREQGILVNKEFTFGDVTVSYCGDLGEKFFEIETNIWGSLSAWTLISQFRRFSFRHVVLIEVAAYGIRRGIDSSRSSKNP